MQKQDLYKGIKTVGYVSFIPFMLAAGPLSGYFAGIFLHEKFNFPSRIVFAGIICGFAAGIMETVRILRILARMNRK
ncbi:MAG: hypothetical protein PHO34_01680 [Candidatus Omnitrophica bacterium]|nr:hypothetical protein [Candidatus Omnitrophota bacterium]MDD5042507.1 hypothetical protein [Candidatus Omnitrophota bacterium]MDD5500732.1 hypothetical protein [Candidatus Omnitrophota bacterium]